MSCREQETVIMMIIFYSAAIHANQPPQTAGAFWTEKIFKSSI